MTANPDGTIAVSSIEGGLFREVARGLWRGIDGSRQLKATEVGGRGSLLDSQNRVGVLQAAPAWRDAAVFQTILGGSLLILALTVLVWPIAWWIRRRHQARPVGGAQVATVRLLTRLAALGDLVYLLGCYRVLAPILDNRVEAYNGTLDVTIRTLQVAAVIPVAAAGLGVWNAVLGVCQPFGWVGLARAVVVAMALVGFLWAGWMAQLIEWSLNY